MSESGIGFNEGIEEKGRDELLLLCRNMSMTGELMRKELDELRERGRDTERDFNSYKLRVATSAMSLLDVMDIDYEDDEDAIALIGMATRAIMRANDRSSKVETIGTVTTLILAVLAVLIIVVVLAAAIGA